jgi:hypothetical protein
VKELYLISKDWKKRFFIRRKFILSWDFDNNWMISTWEKLYKLQILKLRWFDIWSWHNAYSTDATANDWYIDTWACDKSEWFTCNWPAINWWYTDYNLPKDQDDWWEDFTINDITISEFNMAIFPTKDPNYSWYDTGVQIFPFIRLNLQTYFYPVNYKTKLSPESLSKYKMNIQTTFSIRPY